MSSLQISVTSILEQMGIQYVYHIDDYYDNKQIAVESILAQFTRLDKVVLKEALLESFVDDEEINKETLRGCWDEVDQGIQKKLFACIDDSFSWDKKASEVIESLFSKEKIEKLSPLEWDNRKEELQKKTASNKILFLFDNEWGADKLSAGIDNITELLNSEATIPKENLLCALYTHTVSPSEEYSKRKMLSEEKYIDSSRFLVISKQHEEDTFVGSLRTTALIPTLIDFREKINKYVMEATSEVQNIISSLDIVDLEYITLDTSHKEGDWEPDILYRLHKNRHIKEFKNKLFTDESCNIQDFIEKMRSIKNIEAIKTQPTAEVKQLMRHELYDDNINQYNCPIKSGDIFAKGDKKFILLSQPCDLMIRSDGKRRPDGFNCFTNLVEIKNSSASELSGSSKLDYFEENELYVHHSKAHKVELAILDLCTFNTAGEAVIDLNVEEVEHKMEGIKKRYKQVHKEFKKIFGIFEKTDHSTEASKQLFTPYGKGVLDLRINRSEKKINFGLKRISRLLKAKAQVILDDFLKHKGRPASEVDFTI